MKVLIINGSPRLNGNTTVAVDEMIKVFETEGVETVTMQIGNKAIRGCMACGGCFKTGKCVFDDDVNKAAEIFSGLRRSCGGDACLLRFRERDDHRISRQDVLQLPFRQDNEGRRRCGGVARRGGLSATFDELNKYFTIAGMPVASSYYWTASTAERRVRPKKTRKGSTHSVSLRKT